MALYLYAVVKNEGLPALTGEGLDQQPLQLVTQNGLAAVVSEIRERKLRPERKLLAAHQAVLRQLLEFTTPLPMSFGLMSADAEATQALLRRYEENFAEQLSRVAGCVEMGLRVKWEVDNVFDFLLTRYPELAQLRDDLKQQESEHGPLHHARIELGRRIEAALQAERESAEERVTAILERACQQVQAGKTRGEAEILNLACLVDRRRQDEFVARVFEAASSFDGNYAFDYNGPWAPHHFVSLDISLEEADEEAFTA